MKKILVFAALFLNLGLFAQTQNDELRRLNMTEAQLRTHQLTLPDASDIRSNSAMNINVADAEETQKAIHKQFAPPPANAGGGTPAFDPNYFGPIAHSMLKDKVIGYSYQIYKANNAIYTGIWNWAKSPAEGNKGWTVDTRMHVASTSKLMTAIGMVKLLDKKGISLDASINPYLPTYWTRGVGSSNITFRQLLQHRSGLSGENSRCDYGFMKEQIAKGPNVMPGTYANVNFSIMRVIITIMDGRLLANTTFPLLNDQFWDVIATDYFQTYLNKEVFSLAGLPTIGFKPEVGGPTARAYASLTDQTGRDGNWSTVAGGAGMYMSVAQVLKVLGAFRSGVIMPAARAQYMLDNGLGNNGFGTTTAGRVYIRLGGWNINGDEEQSAIYCLPNNVNMAVFINSPIKGYLNPNGSNRHVHDMIYPAIVSSIH